MQRERAHITLAYNLKPINIIKLAMFIQEPGVSQLLQVHEA